MTDRNHIIELAMDMAGRRIAVLEASLEQERGNMEKQLLTSENQIKQYPPITNLPICVITSVKTSADNPPIVADIHAALHRQWAQNAGAKGRFVATKNSGHHIQEEEPELVTEGIRWVLSK